MKKNKMTAVLGPTNTGKTFLAIETMLSFDTGMMGFPLRLLATEATINTKIYHNYLSRNFELVTPTKNLQKKCVNKAIQLVKSGKVKEAEKIIGPAVRYLIKIRCKKIILGCTEIPIAIFAYKSFKKAKKSKIFIDPNLLLANVCMRKYKGIKI